jgi:hypothetical protein
MTSGAEPGGNGMIILTGFVGQACALTLGLIANAKNTDANEMRSLFVLQSGMVVS